MQKYAGFYIRKRSGGIVPFQFSAIYDAVSAAVEACGGTDFDTAKDIAEDVTAALNAEFKRRIDGMTEEYRKAQAHSYS